jgi:hypothetical protein
MISSCDEEVKAEGVPSPTPPDRALTIFDYKSLAND